MTYSGKSTAAYTYSYDVRGNITEVRKNGSVVASYAYDDLNQLIRENNVTANKTWVYAYDERGNILSKDTYAYTTGTLGAVEDSQPYWYYDQWSTEAWGDVLRAYDYSPYFSYDSIGNPLVYIRDGSLFNFTWQNGRQLASGTKGSTSFAYTYNADGLRTKKVVDGVTTEYYWAGSQLAMMVIGADTTSEKILKFYYDAENSPFCFELNGEKYFYITNLQGDIMQIVSASGSVYGWYEYDAWGKLLTMNGNSSSIAEALSLNPLRYRGYIYDSETEFYYLRSRYYDPVVGRFINADGVMGTKGDIATYNLYAYCGNSPVSRYDPNGMAWENDFLRNYLHAVIDEVEAQGYDLAEIGSTFLFMDNSKMRDGQKIYHSTFNCWQQWVGYNDFYDFAFDVGTSMDSEKFQFSYNGSNYVIWAWKGDYLNMGAGAEIGIYRQIGPAWYVDKDLAMRMWVFLDYNGENVISHAGGIHWWCAAFNPNCEKKDVSTLSATFRLRFSDSGMYYAFKNSSKTGKKGKWIYHDNYLVAYYLF